MRRGRNRYAIWPRVPESVRLEACDLDDFGPFFSVFGDESPELSGRTRKCPTTQFSKPRLDLGIGEACIDLLVELLNDLGRCAHRCTKAEPRARLIAGHEISYGGDIRQSLRARHSRHCQRAYLAGPDEFE